MTETAPFQQDGMATGRARGAAPASIPIGATLLCAAGAVAVGLSPIFVRLADIGPQASAFWRTALALPFLWLWARLEQGDGAPLPPRARRLAWLAGLFFVGDLAFWHLSIHHTTVANSTFLAVSAPVPLVALGAWALFADRPSWRFVLSLALAVAGATLLMGASVKIDPAYLRGDVYAVITAMFLSAYMLSLKAAGETGRGGEMALNATLVTTIGLAAVFALSEETQFWPQTLAGWAAVLGLGLLCQSAGQGAIVAAIGRLPAGFAAILMLIEPLTTAILGWVWLGEAMGGLQIGGGALALAAIALARGRRRAR